MIVKAPRDPNLFDLFCAVMEDALRYVQRAKDQGRALSRHSEWVEIQWRKNGMPWIMRTSFNAPEDFGDALRPRVIWVSTDHHKEPEFRQERTFRAVVDYIKRNSVLSRRMRSDTPFFEGLLGVHIGSLLDRYLHTRGAVPLDRGHLLEVYLPLEAYLLLNRLAVVVLVPILNLQFAVKHSKFGRTAITRLSESLQLARGRYKFERGVEEAATHALAIYGHEIDNSDWLRQGQVIADPATYPLDVIETFFAALRIVTRLQTGYGQLFLRPIGWATFYIADLAPIEGTTIRRYPPDLEKVGWEEPVATLRLPEIEKTWKLFEQLSRLTTGSQKSRVQLAIQRLNSSVNRASEDDGVVDAAIGLEALLSDSTQELSYKISLRAAALAKLVVGLQPIAVFDEVKRVYDLRSAIVHGSSRGTAKSSKIVRNGVSVPTVQVAVEHLRSVLKVLAACPEYLDVKRIDADLLLG